MSAPPKPPKKYREDKPTKQTVMLGGHAINLVALAEGEALDHGYLSRVCRGDRIPSIPYAETLANALGWTIQDLLDAVKRRKSDS